MMDDGELPRATESPAPFDTRTRFLGKSLPEIAFALVLAAPGIVLGAVLNNYLITIPFLAAAAFSWVYKKKGLPLWIFLGRWLEYTLVGDQKREGKNSCSDLMEIRDIHGNFFQTSEDEFIALIQVGGVAFDHLSAGKKRRVLGTFRSLLNNKNFDFKLQIIGIPSNAPIHNIAFSPVNGDLDRLNKTEKRLAGALSRRLEQLDKSTKIYDYYIAFRYRCDINRSEKYKINRAEKKLESRYRLIAGHLETMGVDYERLEGKRLVNTLKGFSEQLRGERGG